MLLSALFIVIFLANDCTQDTNSTSLDSESDWGPWEDGCIIVRTRYCHPVNGVPCNNTEDFGASSYPNFDNVSYSTCPPLTTDQITTVISSKKNATNQTVTALTNDTKLAVSRVQIQYASAIQTSSGFAYIAIIFIVLIYTVPLVSDLLKVLNRRNRNLRIAPMQKENKKTKTHKRRKTVQSQPGTPKIVLPKQLDASDFIQDETFVKV